MNHHNQLSSSGTEGRLTCCCTGSPFTSVFCSSFDIFIVIQFGPVQWLMWPGQAGQEGSGDGGVDRGREFGTFYA